jgi:hypothetical protein
MPFDLHCKNYHPIYNYSTTLIKDIKQSSTHAVVVDSLTLLLAILSACRPIAVQI